MNNRPVQLLIIILMVSIFSFAQEKKYDILNHKYFGALKGKVIKISDETVQFKKSDTGLTFNYEKKDINYIILSTGEWISFNQSDNELLYNSSGGWGYFHFSPGAVNTLKPVTNSEIRKYGISFYADLNYEANKFYSVGFLIGYDAVNLKSKEYLNLSGNNGSGTGVSGGTLYQVKIGGISRFWFFPSSFISPVISIFVGYENLIISEIELNNSGRVSKISGVTKSGFVFSSGAGLKFSTGKKSGFLLSGDYNWFFSKKERYEYLTFHFGYLFPIN